MAALSTRLRLADGLTQKHQKNDHQSTTLAQYSKEEEHQVPLTQHQRSHHRQFKRPKWSTPHSRSALCHCVAEPNHDRGAIDLCYQTNTCLS